MFALAVACWPIGYGRFWYISLSSYVLGETPEADACNLASACLLFLILGETPETEFGFYLALGEKLLIVTETQIMNVRDINKIMENIYSPVI